MLKQLVIAAGVLLASYLYSRLRYLRGRQYAHIPQLPNHLLWGHLKIFGEFMSRGTHDRHPDKIFEEMWISIGRPPVMLVDLRPVNPPMVLVPSHSIAEQISKPCQLFPLSFTTQHLWALLPLVLESMVPFLKYLDQFAISGEEVSLEKLISNLTFDVIGAAVLHADLNSQQMDISKQGELPRLFAELMDTYADDKNNLPWWIVPLTTLRRYRVAKRIEVLVQDTIRQRYTELKEEAKGNRSRSIAALSFQDTDALTPQLLSETSDQVRNFLFAGHDTTTSMLQWALYELSRTPRALKAVRDELDEIFGPHEVDPLSMCASFAQSGEEIFPRLHYINAVIRETLRLHPPAGSTRMTPPGSGFAVRAPTGEEYNLDGTIMYLCHSVIQREPSVFGDTADVWVPERWLGEAGKNIPASAWRPFERGPRNCIGSELANLESRIIISIVARKYDFVKVGLGETDFGDNGLPVLDENGQFKVKSQLYNDDRKAG
ncbi:hypothetical protein KVR01_011835 [Diaporthe batatas]|uniref:uncharacterized protein n=1 Tax=Diaporthe batatas TaxID=748121 RepID=UPI001D05BAFF|nr:uncharacterized protein KVR01_011835 [Diaporthe batatas]KAG8158074.1 hypothetical protein KVR01_011835 [Diaporthe batatas]